MIAPAPPPPLIREVVVEPLCELFFLVELDLVWEDEVELVVVVFVGVVDVPVVTVGTGVVEVVVGVHDAETLCTGPMFGGTSADGGVPGAALTVKVRTWPVSSVTVTVH
ncbi:MAG TPA: hypothetical protein VKU35_06400 [Candidatus Limnocylindria bacterium]|nr:hypothetical protein [Candidatus Limnocylindria bacterium]